MKMNVPLNEAEECVRKVKERNMGYLFENMEKLDIQEERRKTREARKAADDAKKWAEEAENRAKEAERHAEEAERHVEEAERHAEEETRRAEKMQENLIRRMIEWSMHSAIPREKVVQELMEFFEMEQEAAREKVALYWTKEQEAHACGQEAAEGK